MKMGNICEIIPIDDLTEAERKAYSEQAAKTLQDTAPTNLAVREIDIRDLKPADAGAGSDWEETSSTGDTPPYVATISATIPDDTNLILYGVTDIDRRIVRMTVNRDKETLAEFAPSHLATRDIPQGNFSEMYYFKKAQELSITFEIDAASTAFRFRILGKTARVKAKMIG